MPAEGHSTMSRSHTACPQAVWTPVRASSSLSKPCQRSYCTTIAAAVLVVVRASSALNWQTYGAAGQDGDERPLPKSMCVLCASTMPTSEAVDAAGSVRAASRGPVKHRSGLEMESPKIAYAPANGTRGTDGRRSFLGNTDPGHGGKMTNNAMLVAAPHFNIPQTNLPPSPPVTVYGLIGRPPHLLEYVYTLQRQCNERGAGESPY
ncbi:hypothetical protein PWT90_06098 [Aphanocladium album]|nr:hypothetical protein PWT90_06098 [Aphanocladium album]